MPRYFFDIHDGVEIIDRDGEDLPDTSAARMRALKLASDYTTEPKMLGKDGGAIIVDVREGESNIRLTVRLVFSVECG